MNIQQKLEIEFNNTLRTRGHAGHVTVDGDTYTYVYEHYKRALAVTYGDTILMRLSDLTTKFNKFMENK